MPYDNNDIMQNVPERLRSKVKGIGLPEQMPQIHQESDTSFLQDLPLPGGTSLNTVAELTSNAIDSIKETNVYKKYFYNDAEKLAEAQKISNDLKIPVNAILANDTNMEKARDIYAYKQKQQQIMPNGEKTFDMKAVYAAYPELQRLANMDETQAAIALHNIENVKQTHGIIEAFKTGWHMDSLQLERSKLGQKGYFGELTDADRKRLTEIEEEMKNAKVLPDLLEAPVESIVGNTAQQAPMMFRQFMNGQMLAIGGAVAGAAVGATGGFTVGGITAVPGAAYGARVGYGIGARLGYAKEMYQEILGNYYLDYIGYKDRQGRQLMSDNQARAWATVSALAETGIEMANVESVIGILGSEPGTKAAANIVRDIVRRGADSASAKAQLKDWLINNARNMGVVALSESAEEGVQNAVSMGINTMAAKANPGGNIPSYSAVEMAQGAMEGAWQALPASIGFGAMAAAGSNLKYVRKVATAANEGREYVENARKNEAGITMVDNLLNNKAANKLAKEQPEVYKNIIKNTLEGTGAENVYVDTELLLQQDGGVQILNQLAAAAGIEGQALQDVIETKADIAVPVQEYVNIDGAQELHDKLRDLISFAVGADCFARTRRIAQQMKKTYDKMIAGEMERALQNVHNLVEANFEEGPQRDMAEFILGQYEDPMEGIKEYREERQRELDEMLEPVLATMREGMGQGVAMLKDEETGHYYRMSNNDPWYSKYYAENKKAPSQSEMKQIAEDILTGNNYYGVPGFEFRDAESMEYAEANRAQIESIRSELATLDAIEEKIGNISKGELAATEGLTPEGIRVYNRVIEALKGASSKAVRKQEAMGALLTAHHAERYAEAMRRAGYENYTAEDYLNRIRFEVNGNNATSGRFNQAAVYDWPQKAALNTMTIKGDEFGEYQNLRELRKSAKQFYKETLQGTTAYNSLIGEVRLNKGFPEKELLFSKTGLNEMMHYGAKAEKMLCVKYLKELIENSQHLTEQGSVKEKHAGEHFYYLHSRIMLNNVPHYVTVSIKEDRNGDLIYYNHNVYNENEYYEQYKKIEDAKNATPKPGGSSTGGEVQQASSFNNIITENGEVYNQSAYHGTPHSFERFDLGAIGTGEGNQAHGWGLYFAADKKIADERYRKRLTNDQYVIETDEATYYFDIEKQDWVDKKTGQPVGGMSTPLGHAVWEIGFREGNVQAALKALKGQRDALIEENDSSNAQRLDFLIRTIKLLEEKKFNYRKDNGSLFEVDIPENDVLLDEDKPLNEQPLSVRKAILEYYKSRPDNYVTEGITIDDLDSQKGGQFYKDVVFQMQSEGAENPQKAASELLNEYGIKGITYDGARDGRCFVVFDDKAISIINRYNQSVGIHARTANRELLNEAQAMAAEGKMQREIYEKTGWRRGADGKWRFEIPDNLDKIDIKKLQSTKQFFTLGEIYDNEKLYEAYPFLREVTIQKEKLDGNRLGYSEGDYLIVIDNDVDEWFTPGTIIHELQHIIQNYEGFASGGNTRQVRTLVNEAIRKKTEEARSLAPHATMYYNRRREYEMAMIMGDEARMKELEGPIKKLEQEIPNKARRDRIYRLFSEADKLLKNANKMNDRQLYMNLYGEKEARAAEEKAKISTRMERNRQKGNTQYDEILRDYTERLPEELQPVAKEYVDLIKRPLAERDFDRETEIEEKLLDNEIASEFYNKISDSQWEAAGTGELQKEYNETVFLPEKADAVVIFNDNLVASYSVAEPQVQGQTAILDNGKRIIYLYENADQSTFMHEMAHIFFADMRELAEMENAPAQIKRDWQTLQDWTAWNDSQINEYIGTAVYNEFNQRDKEIRAAQEKGYTYRGGERIELGTLLEEWRQERFARGFEEYLRKGKAPKESLKGVFTRFKNWLLKIYKDIKTIGAEPSKEVKAVMDRMLATQEEIDAVMQKEDIDAFRKAGGFKYLSGTSAEMWQKIYDDIHKDAYSKVIKVAMQDLTEQGQKEREQKIADERAAARERISQEPVFIVWQYLQNNPQLDKEAAAQQIGNMTAEQYDFELNERGGSLDAAVDNYMRAYERELDAAAPDKAELARRAEEAVDTSYYKKLLTAYELEALDKSVQAEQKASRKINDTADAGAAQAINRLDRERAKREGYEEEIKRLREQRGEERKQQRALRDVAVGNVDTIREYAERKISTLHVMEAANPVMWKKLSRQKARETEEAIAKNDWETARKAKKEQLVYDVMTDLATGNKKFVDKAVSTMKRRADIIRRDKNLSAYDRYVYNHLLYVFGMAKRDAPMPPEQPNFLDLLAGYENNLELSFVDAEGNITLPDWLLNAATATRPRDKGYIDLTVDGFKTFKDLMDNIYTVGREAKMAKAVTDRDGKKIDLDEAAAEIVTTVIDTAFKKKTADRKFGNESVIEKSARLAEEASMNLIKPETILQAMGDTAMRYIYDPMREAANTEMRMNETLRQQQADIFAAYHDGKVAKYLAQGMGEKEARAAAEKELNEMGSKKQYSIGKENITKENLLAIALNWGTDINRKRVVDGYQVSYGFIEYALRQLDAADWQFVQNIWDLFETYWTDLQRVEANVTGVTLEKQPAVPFQIIGADGGVYNLNGGYYPLRYDPVKNNITALREINEAIKTKMQDATRLGTKLGSTKERSQGNVSLMIRTDLNVIDEVLGENIHNIAQRETIRDVNRLINNIDVKNAVETYWGKATWRTLNKWSLDCWAPEPQAKNIYEKASQRIRMRQTQAVLGFRVSTALLNICNIGPMMDYIGPIEATKAIKDFYLHPQRQYNTIMAKSVFLRNRAETMDRDFGRLVKDNSNSAITKSAFWLITKTDLMLACPLWMHEYQKAYQDGIAKGVDPVNVEAAAVRAGDAAVRRVFGSGQTVDMAEIQRGNEFTKQLTMFYSYFSVVHNAIALKVWEARKARVDGKKLTQAMAPVLTGIIFWMAIPAVIEAGIRAMIDDDDDDLADVAKGAGITFISTAVGGIPVLRDALPMALKAAAGEPVFNIRNQPLIEIANQMLNVTRAINSDNKDALDVAKAVLRMADMITGLPQILTDGMITAARWIDEGNLTEEDIQHYLWSILFGKNSKKN